MKISEIITPVNCQFGAPMGRNEQGIKPTDKTKVYKKRVRLDSGGYDSGGAYWGIGSPLYVEFTKDLNYIHYFRD
jgi:hypothetical protein